MMVINLFGDCIFFLCYTRCLVEIYSAAIFVFVFVNHDGLFFSTYIPLFLTLSDEQCDAL